MNESLDLLTPEQFRILLPEVNGRRPCAATIRRWCIEGRIHSTKLGGRVVIPRSEVERVTAEIIERIGTPA